VEIPIACTLGKEQASDRLEEWRHFLGSSIEAADPAGPDRLRLRLDPSPETLIAAVDLARREKSCCGFFEFSIDLQPDGNWLVVGVPPDAAAILADFSRLVPQVLFAGDQGQ
jgi:hypothetical protein